MSVTGVAAAGSYPDAADVIESDSDIDSDMDNEQLEWESMLHLILNSHFDLLPTIVTCFITHNNYLPIMVSLLFTQNSHLYSYS